MPMGARQLRPDSGRNAGAGAALTDRNRFETGRVIGGVYRLERQIGRSRVFRGIDRSGRVVAVKSGARRLIEHEFAMLSALPHPHIVRALDCVADSGVPDRDDEAFVVLEYLSGGDLVSLAGSAPRYWLGAVAAIVDALACVHAHGFVHRDLKARNVLIGEDGAARLIDFVSALPIGSPFDRAGTTVVAPARGDGPVAPGDDVFALAALIHELLHGRPPPLVTGTGADRWPPGPPGSEVLASLVSQALSVRGGQKFPALDRFGAVIKSMRQAQETGH